MKKIKRILGNFSDILVLHDTQDHFQPLYLTDTLGIYSPSSSQIVLRRPEGIHGETRREGQRENLLITRPA